jgi:error-prone DNA polymerase
MRHAQTIPFAELAVTTNFSFLRGASHPEELVEQAINLGLSGLGIADRNSLAGIVRAHAFLRENRELAPDFRLAIGSRLVFRDGTPDILVFPKHRAAYGRLTRLLTRGNLRAEKGNCLLDCQDLLDHAEGQQLIVMAQSTWEDENTAKISARSYKDFAEVAKQPSSLMAELDEPRNIGNFSASLKRLVDATQGHVWLAASMTYGRNMRRQLAERVDQARNLGLPLLATNDVLMHEAARRPLQDVLTCIRHNLPLESIGRRLEANAERHLKSASEMAHLFAEAPQSLGETIAFLDGLDFSLDELAYDYPLELREGYATPQEALEAFVHAGARERYKQGVPPKVRQQIDYELKLVAALNYAPYFLTVHDIMRFARGKKILCQGRGSAANSTLCYCLRITDVDPDKNDLLFERFISAERKEPPDIDVDFEHERREEVMQYIYDRYGRARAGLTATVITYRTRSALRDVGKVFGLSEDNLNALSSTVWGGSSGSVQDKEACRVGLDPAEPRLAKVLALAAELVGFPRHLSQHTGGFVITHTRLDEVVPIANAAMDQRTTVEWDKDDLDQLGILKVDVLALGMLTCLRKGFDLLRDHYGLDYEGHLSKLPAEEPAVYAMISRADTIGVFQIESRAQMSMLPRLRPKEFYDLVIEVAIVRPGPIQGDMVHPYLRRRQGLEPINYPSQELESVLGKTLGVPLFQEQAMKIAIVAAGFAPAEADKLRRAMATFKRTGTVTKFREKMIEGMVARNYPRDFAERCFKQIEGFGTYGFPESHAASFALLVYASAWMKCRYPDVFACALLNSQPMGFYAPAQIVRDAREHGIPIEEVDVNYSQWDSTLSQWERVGPEGRGEGLQSAEKAFENVPPHPPPVAAPSPAGRGLAVLHPRHVSMRDVICSSHAIRLGFQQIKGVSKDAMDILVAQRDKGYDSIRDLWLRTRLSPTVLAALAEADAFRSLGLDRREALWAVRGLNRSGDKDDLPLLQNLSFRALEPEAHLPPMRLGEHVVEDYRHLSLSLKAHPVAFLREKLAARHIIRTEELAQQKPGQRVTTAGLVLVRQRPGSASGVIFLTLEDETGIANAIIWPKVFERLRPIIIAARCIAITGRVQAESNVIHVVVEQAEDLTSWLGLLSRQGRDISSLARADAVKRPHSHDPREPPEQINLFDHETTNRQDNMRKILPKGRNFH